MWSISAPDLPSDPGAQLRSFLMLGMWARERANIDAAVRSVPADPAEWTTAGLTALTWASTVGAELTDAIPGIIADSGMRPAAAVTVLIRSALLFGVEVGRQVEKQAVADVT